MRLKVLLFCPVFSRNSTLEKYQIQEVEGLKQLVDKFHPMS